MKQNRHQKIAELVSRYEIETQEELAEKLKEAGFTVTQATISRDIRQMNLSKLPTGNGRQKYVILKKENALLSDKYIRVLRDGFVSMDMAQNILVMRTVSGMAMAVAAALDAIHFGEVVGCIAGDDTIMIAVPSVEDTRILMGKIRELMKPYRESKIEPKDVSESACQEPGADRRDGSVLSAGTEHSDGRDGRRKIRHSWLGGAGARCKGGSGYDPDGRGICADRADL